MAPEQARWWSWRRQRLDRTARGVEDALHSVVALSSANPSAPLSLLARVPRMLQGMYEGATMHRTAVRLPAMRRAVWLLAADTAHIPFHACRGTGVNEQTLLRRTGVSSEYWNELRARILQVCERPMDAREIKSAVGGDDEKTSAVLSVLASTGEVVRVRAPSLFSNAFAFASTEAWIGSPLPAMPRDDALTFLAGDYLQAYGPITVDDFVWWSGIPRNRCEPALEAHEPVRLDDGYVLWPAHARAFEQSRSVANRVNLLPAWDAYPMGYLDRSRLGEPEAVELAFDRAGNSLPIILVEGRIGGLWDFRMSRAGTLTVTIRLFDSAGERIWEAVEAEASAVASLFQARSLSIVRERAARATRVVEVPHAPQKAPPKVVRRKIPRKKRPGKVAASKKRVAKTSTSPRKAGASKARVISRKAPPRKTIPSKSAPVKAGRTTKKPAATKKPATIRSSKARQSKTRKR
ncbi:MAG: DNA glycosylase AlkZ-like family protein [Actinomycetota bacterium]|nr:winged helix DNA-binding domain-containing protein [Actinomycetota bacterium]